MIVNAHSILVVDNVTKRRQNLKAMLHEREESVLEARTSEDALRTINQDPVDLVITETELPTRSGLYLLQEVKKLYPETEVILITHNASSFSLLQALRFGAFDFIVRPIDTSEILFNVIDRAFNQIDLRLQNQALLTELEHRNKELEHSLAMMTALSDAIEKINSAIEVGELLSRLLNSAQSTLKAHKGLIALISGNNQTFGVKMTRNIHNDFTQKFSEKLEEGLLLDIARSGSSMVVPDQLPTYMTDRINDDENALFNDPGLLAVPLYHRDRAIGMMVLLGHHEGSPFSDQNLQFLVQLAHHAAIALEKAGIIHLLKRQGKNIKG